MLDPDVLVSLQILKAQAKTDGGTNSSPEIHVVLKRYLSQIGTIIVMSLTMARATLYLTANGTDSANGGTALDGICQTRAWLRGKALRRSVEWLFK